MTLAAVPSILAGNGERQREKKDFVKKSQMDVA